MQEKVVSAYPMLCPYYIECTLSSLVFTERSQCYDPHFNNEETGRVVQSYTLVKKVNLGVQHRSFWFQQVSPFYPNHFSPTRTHKNKILLVPMSVKVLTIDQPFSQSCRKKNPQQYNISPNITHLILVSSRDHQFTVEAHSRKAW